MQHKKKFMEILGIIIIITTLIGFFAFELPSRFSDWYYAVYLTPKTISVDKSDWSMTKSVEIVNNNPYPIYSVYLKISEVNTGTNIDGVQIKPEPHIVETNFSSTTDMNAIVISGHSKIDGKKWKNSIIYKINANSTINIKLTIPPASIPEKFKLKITDFSKSSNPILENYPATLVNFEIKK